VIHRLSLEPITGRSLVPGLPGSEEIERACRNARMLAQLCDAFDVGPNMVGFLPEDPEDRPHYIWDTPEESD